MLIFFKLLKKKDKRVFFVVERYLKKFFNCRIALQNFVVFCHTSRISHRYTHVPSLPDFPHISLPMPSACHRFPESDSKFPLAICFTHGIVNFCITLSLHLPFSLLSSRFVHRSVLYVCFSTAALKINSPVLSLQIPYICVSIWYLHFSFWLTSLCIMGSSFVHLIRTDSNAFLLWLSSILLYIRTTASYLSIHLSMGI